MISVYLKLAFSAFFLLQKLKRKEITFNRPFAAGVT